MSDNNSKQGKKFTDVLGQFLSRAREAHVLGYGLMMTYLGIYHNLKVPKTGMPLETLALTIGLGVLGVTPAAVSKIINKKLPQGAAIPKNLRKEAVYFWLGMTLIYVARHVQGIVF